MSRTAIGILIDVSDSMRQVYSDIQSKNEDEKTSRMQTVFDTVVQAASEESGKSNCGLFAVAFGIKTESGVEYLIDIFSLLKFQNIVRRHMKENGYITDDDSNRPRWHEDGQGPGYELLISLLRYNGAPNCDEYVRKYLTQRECFFLHTFYSKEPHLLATAIDELPSACRGQFAKYAYDGLKKMTAPTGLGSLVGYMTGPTNDTAENERLNARMQVQKCTDHILERHSHPGSIHLKEAVNIIEEAAEIGHKKTRTKNLTKHQLDRIIDSIEPYIYGPSTSLCAALKSSYSIFGNIENRNAEWKMLLVMTDGYPTDGELPHAPWNQKINVATCLIEDNNPRLQYRTLRFAADTTWSSPRQDLFNLCTTVPSLQEEKKR
ncbi:uncharacterized protein LOC129588795 isoform X1 [Paramacrobiotus metropolitanus]|uniref:uncharacterized protein LOC129588795 isoform X1 n=1 Tax=Paramacrobiotus metropolitanus TaxID=2943436 RepID=UPI002445EAB9|nr:uncharacterized protein LOC129588795 isoform X1 [Paramacrobiotus metropolitanus]